MSTGEVLIYSSAVLIVAFLGLVGFDFWRVRSSSNIYAAPGAPTMAGLGLAVLALALDAVGAMMIPW